MRTEIIPASDTGTLIERIVAVRDPAKAAERQAARIKTLTGMRDWAVARAGGKAESLRITKGRRMYPEDHGLTRPEGMTLAEFRKHANKWLREEVAYVKSGGGHARESRMPDYIVDINRPLTEARIQLYAEEMVAGRWYDSPDPIVVTTEGFLVNGQHRLMAATRVIWEDDVVPNFLVVWDADRETALLMDEAARSTKDRRHIALAYARAS